MQCTSHLPEPDERGTTRISRPRSGRLPRRYPYPLKRYGESRETGMTSPLETGSVQSSGCRTQKPNQHTRNRFPGLGSQWKMNQRIQRDDEVGMRMGRPKEPTRCEGIDWFHQLLQEIYQKFLLHCTSTYRPHKKGSRVEMGTRRTECL